MKKTILLSTIGVLSALSSVAGAQEIGRVLSSTPVIQQVAVPRQICGPQQYVQTPSSGGGAVVGAIVGGLLGNTIGHGMGRAAATGAGVIAGAAVGDSIESRPAQAVQNCTTQTSYENRTVGYNVLYEYAGKQYNVQMPYDPGPTIRLQVTPMSGGPSPDVGIPSVQAPAEAPAQASGVVVAPPVAPAVGQPVARIVGVPQPVAAYPAYPAYPAYSAYPAYPAYPAYYSAPYYPPIGISLGFGYVRHSHRWR